MIAWMPPQPSRGTDEPRAVGAKRLQNGGIINELNIPETANWLRKEKVFTDGFRGMAIMRDKAVPIIVEYVPVSHSPDMLTENRKLNTTPASTRVSSFP